MQQVAGCRQNSDFSLLLLASRAIAIVSSGVIFILQVEMTDDASIAPVRSEAVNSDPVPADYSADPRRCPRENDVAFL
ncbi:hypothetical protein FIBSPDRAFT_864462 [Athelia psychrophila]|uniref:Uncharacterized protein n=1 Tax=Athelia psychrophila TaxID=1759441 RepID=A0A166GHB8_9AGAM|nr:hypothetical protein FIBSPDRAFT_864462 [Fibularhizoctonia sp. CBS 109695]